MRRPSVVIHSHFYQPPREDPWNDRVPEERSAAPYHDWNERILAECYRPVTEARVLDGEGRIADIVNTLEWMSWDGGPTLMRWLAREAPETYRAFVEADRRSLGRLGFGNAIAAPYHHVILPLASRRDKVTEVRWGISDFRRRFGRPPEGMWLPEAAVDSETLEVLALEGIRFTILGPGQVRRPPAGGGPGRVDLGGGRSIAVFVYDGPLSHDVAFGSLLRDAGRWVDAMLDRAGEPGQTLVSLATDGETFGHHHAWADMALAATLTRLEHHPGVRLENFPSFLAANPPTETVELVEPSSWSCAHGVERWRSECGCKLAGEVESSQAWRAVLRDALDELADRVHARFASEAGRLVVDPWAVRDAFGETLDAGEAARRSFAREALGRSPVAAGPGGGDDGEGRSEGRAERADEHVERLLTLLEAERDALRMFTSCGWFFDDLARLEPLQVLRYAAHALDLLGEHGGSLEARLRAKLAGALSNDSAAGDARRLWDEEIRGRGLPDVVAEGAVAAHGSVAASEEVAGATGTHGPPGPGGGALQAGRARAHAAPLVRAVRAFVRAPGPAAARAVLDRIAAVGPDDHVERRAAEALFARTLPRAGRAPDPAVRRVASALGFGDGFFEGPALRASGPVGFVFGLHLHQPVGNFDEVFRSHTDEVYHPFLRHLADRELLPLTLHVSGPLLEWLEAHDHDFLDLVGRLAAEGSVELLLSGMYEPILPALSRAERVEQIGWMRDWIEGRFGVGAQGLWLTERVWEPDLVEDLAAAGVRYAFVDDRHFLVNGHPPHALHRPHTTESGGRPLSLLPIDEHLRYLVPFQPPSELERYLRALRGGDQPLAILADDGEKFGGWPGTAEWVWHSGWLDDFTATLSRLLDDGVVEMLRADEAVDLVPAAAGSYPSAGSYREMEGWSLPPSAAVVLESVEEALRPTALAEVSGRVLRGGHWRSFLGRYTESALLHRKAGLLSERAGQAGADEGVRRAIGRARCNDPYWHGVFGGLYLRHLREAAWANLAEAEERLFERAPLTLEVLDAADAEQGDLWIHSGDFSLTLSPARGGAVVEWTIFAERRNLADVLTRRWESYHRVDRDEASGTDDDGAPSIHDLEARLGFDRLPPYDLDDRALTAERILPADVSPDAYERADYEPIHSWTREFPRTAWRDDDEGTVRVAFSFDGPGRLRKDVVVRGDGSLELAYRWDPGAFPPDAWFAPELSVARETVLELDPEAGRIERYPVLTVSKSERGAEETLQGHALTPMWPCALGRAGLRLRP